MSTGWLIINIVMVVVATLLVAGPAVLVPLLLDREHRIEASTLEVWTASAETISMTESTPGVAAV